VSGYAGSSVDVGIGFKPTISGSVVSATITWPAATIGTGTFSFWLLPAANPAPRQSGGVAAHGSVTVPGGTTAPVVLTFTTPMSVVAGTDYIVWVGAAGSTLAGQLGLSDVLTAYSGDISAPAVSSWLGDVTQKTPNGGIYIPMSLTGSGTSAIWTSRISTDLSAYSTTAVADARYLGTAAASTFAPTVHTHTKAQITNLVEVVGYVKQAANGTWGNRPATPMVIWERYGSNVNDPVTTQATAADIVIDTRTVGA
jgi:hypothetical protein